MSRCTDNRLGDMLYAYELGMLDSEDRQAFELHLYECNHCFERAQRFQPSSHILRHSDTIRGTIGQLAASEADRADRARSVRKPAPSRPKFWTTLVPTSVAAVAVLIFLIVQPWQIQIQPTNEAVAAQNRLAVMTFENLQDPEDSRKLGEIAANLLTTDLSESQFVQVISSQRLKDLKRSLVVADHETTNIGMDTEIARLAEARWMLKGAILQEKPLFVLTAQLVEVESGAVVASQRVTGTDNDDIFDLVDKLTVEVKRDLSLPVEALEEPDRMVADVTTRSPEAYRYYLEGVDYRWKLYWEEARASFNKVLALDSTFAMVYYHLAAGEAGRVADSLYLLALKHVDRASRKERYYIRAAGAAVEGNTELAIAEMKEMVRLYPDEKEGYMVLGDWHYSAGRYEEAVKYYSQAIKQDPAYKQPYNGLAYSYFELEDTARSLEALDKYLSLAPDEANPYNTRGELLARQGRMEEAIESYKKSLEIKPDFIFSVGALAGLYLEMERFEELDALIGGYAESDDPGWRAGVIRTRAYRYLFTGQFQQTLRLLDSALMVGSLEDLKRENPLAHRLASTIHQVLGNCDQAIADMQACKESLERLRHRDVAPYNYQQYVVSTAAQCGNLDLAEKSLAEMQAELRDAEEHQPWLDFGAGSLQLARGDITGSLASLRKAADGLPGIYQARLQLSRALREAALFEEAAREYEALFEIKFIGRIYWPVEFISANYQYGTVLEELGRHEEAVKYYERFLGYWGESDSAIDMVSEARSRLAALKNKS